MVTEATRALTRAREKPVPWKESRVVDQREEFIHRWLKMREPVTTLAQHFGVSRKTVYKWIDRFHQGGLPNLVDRSRAPHYVAQAMTPEVAEALLELRRKHPLWG